jgi:hypothetical protein
MGGFRVNHIRRASSNHGQIFYNADTECWLEAREAGLCS